MHTQTSPDSSGTNNDRVESNRIRFLAFLYEKSGGRPGVPVPYNAAAQALGLQDEEAMAASGYLRKKEYTTGTLETECLTPLGIDAHERSVARGTESGVQAIHHHHGPTYTATVGGAGSANIMQGSTDGTQTASFAVAAPDEAVKSVADLVAAFRAKMPELHLDQETAEYVETSLHALESQTKQGAPDKKALRYHLKALQGFLGNLAMNAAANLAAQPLIHQLQQVIPLVMGKPS